ncbi:MAG TPA: hypothetical protein VF984_15120 [Actinomycetota bacterium]
MLSVQRRTAGVVVALVGAVFVLSAVVNHLFAVGPAFERLTDGFRPAMQAEPITTLNSDLAGLQAVTEEFGTTAVPMLSTALQMTPEEFTAFMGEQFPDVATGIQQLPAIVTNFQGVVGTLEAEQQRFASADAIPTTSLPATTVPWGLLIAGIVLILIGIAIATVPGRIAPVAAIAVGALLVAAPLALSLPRKAADADTMNAHLKPVYTAEMLTGAKASLATVGAMGTQMQEQMLPALGTQLGMDQAALQTFLQENLPAMGAGMQAMPDAMGRFTATVQLFEAHLGDYDTMKDVTLEPIVWTIVAGGAVALIAGLWALVAGRRPTAVPEEVPARQHPVGV